MSMDVGAIMDFESGQLDDEGILELFADGIRSGQVWHLQGFYGRTAQGLIDAGLIDHQGQIDRDAVEAAREAAFLNE